MAIPMVMAVGKESSNPLIFNDSPLTGVNTPGSDENRMKLIYRNWCTKVIWSCQRLVAEKNVADKDDKEDQYFDSDSQKIQEQSIHWRMKGICRHKL